MTPRPVTPLIAFSLLAAVTGALVFLAVFNFQHTRADNGIISVWSTAAAAFLCASLFWWLLLTRPGRTHWKYASLAGALTGLFAHPLAFWLSILGWLAGGGELQSSILEAIALSPFLAVALSLWSWMLFGWLTAPLGAILGGVLAAHFARFQPADIYPSTPLGNESAANKK